MKMKHICIISLILLGCSQISSVQAQSRPLTFEMYPTSPSYIMFKVESGIGERTLIVANPTPITAFNSSLLVPFQYINSIPYFYNESISGEFISGITIIFDYGREIQENWSAIFIAAISVDHSNATLEIVQIHHESNPIYIRRFESLISSSNNSTQSNNYETLYSADYPSIGIFLISALILFPILSIISLIRYKKIKLQEDTLKTKTLTPIKPNARKRKKSKWRWSDDIGERLKDRFPNLK